jgi:hypothetical protein
MPEIPADVTASREASDEEEGELGKSASEDACKVDGIGEEDGGGGSGFCSGEIGVESWLMENAEGEG